MSSSLLTAINPDYFSKILQWKHIVHEPVGGLFKIDQFHNYNKLIDINSIFSSRPFGDIVDRTDSVKQPFLFQINRPWHVPTTSSASLDQVLQQRTQWYLDKNQKLNLCWSGGLDSTCLVIAFLIHAFKYCNITRHEHPYTFFFN